jgi:hypothetical protein
MFLRKAQCTGEVRLLGARIEGQLNCVEARFSNPNGNALNAERLVVDGDMLLEQTQCTGEVRMPGAHINGQLNCIDASFNNPDGLAIHMERATVVQAVWMRPACLEGGLDLTYARVGAWYDERLTWPRRIYLDGFAYDAIDAPDASIRDRLRSWLPRNTHGGRAGAALSRSSTVTPIWASSTRAASTTAASDTSADRWAGRDHTRSQRGGHRDHPRATACRHSRV